MRMLKKTILSLSLMLGYANSIYATTNEIIEIERVMLSDKLIILLIAILLVGVVLFLGYKMDKSEAQEKRKKEIVKKNMAETNKTSYNSNNGEINDLEETAVLGMVYPDLNEELENDIKVQSDFDKTAVIEKIDLSSVNYEKENSEVIEEFKETEELVENQDIIVEDIDDYDKNWNSTIEFNTTEVQNLENKNVEEKPKRGRKPAAKKEVTTKNTSSKVIDEAEEEKPKRGRKPAVKKEDKIEVKIEVEEKPKRGRKPAVKKETAEVNESIEEVKKDAVSEKTKKTKTSSARKTTETKVKKTRADSTRRAAALEAEKEKEIIKKIAMEKKAAAKKAAAKKAATKKTSTKKAATSKTASKNVKKTRASSVRKEREKMQKK